MAASGRVVWPSEDTPIWRFDWRLGDAPDAEGIAITQAYYKGHKVFWKASLPSLRVRYVTDCGPFKDPLNFQNCIPRGGRYVGVNSLAIQGARCVTLDSYHEISAYRLTHRWVFWENGTISPRLYSAGLYCDADHWHHAYWRFDFDISGSADDLALEYNATNPDFGYGPGWHHKGTEIKRVKNPATRRSWAILDKQERRGYHILPGPHDGTADEFANGDVWIMRYRREEDRNGMQGDARDDALAPYIDGEDVDGQDVVIWYCGHLLHRAEGDRGEWHGIGPELVPFGSW